MGRNPGLTCLQPTNQSINSSNDRRYPVTLTGLRLCVEQSTVVSFVEHVSFAAPPDNFSFDVQYSGARGADGTAGPEKKINTVGLQNMACTFMCQCRCRSWSGRTPRVTVTEKQLLPNMFLSVEAKTTTTVTLLPGMEALTRGFHGMCVSFEIHPVGTLVPHACYGSFLQLRSQNLPDMLASWQKKGSCSITQLLS